MTSVVSPAGVGTWTRAPRSASHTLSGSSQYVPSPWRLKKGCSWTRVLTIRSPRGPPNGPALPSPRTRICVPESTPARETHRNDVDGPSYAPAPTSRAGTPGRTTAGPAGITGREAGYAELEAGALSGVGERQLHREVNVLAAPPGLQRLAAHDVPEAVIQGPGGRIAEDAIGFGDLLEERLGLGFPEIHVRRVLAGQLSVGPPDLAWRRRGGDAQEPRSSPDAYVVPTSCLRGPRTRRRRPLPLSARPGPSRPRADRRPADRAGPWPGPRGT